MLLILVMETTRIIEVKENISKYSEQVEILSSLGVEGMLVGELLDNIDKLRSANKKLMLNILELEKLEEIENNNSKLDDFKEEY